MTDLTDSPGLKRYSPVLYLLCAWCFNFSFGFINIGLPRESIEARDAGAAVIVPLLTALCWIGYRVCLKGGLQNLARVIVHRRDWTVEKTQNKLVSLVLVHLKKRRLLIAILSTSLSTLFLLSEGVIQAKTGNALRPFLLLQALPLWFSVFYMMFTLGAVARLTHQHLKRHLRVRLFEIEKLEPLCNSVTINFLLASSLIAVYPINGFFVSMSITEIYLLMVFSAFVLAIFFYPMVVVRGQLLIKKNFTLERINASLNEQIGSPAENQSNRRLVDDQARLQYISDLLTVRKEVDSASLWPINLPFTFKLLVVMSLPVFSWIGAGIMSQLLKGVV